MPEFVGQPGESAAVADQAAVKRPRRFKVLLHNDHYTTMEFVVTVLVGIFQRSETQAVQVMMNVHKNGIGVAGVYVKSIAEAKVLEVHNLAKEHGYPLKCSMEPE